MITNYIPNTCGYGLNNLKKVVHIFSESANVIHIDNGEAYVTSGITDLQTISATSVSFEETTAYDDRFKFQKTVTATVNGFAKLSALGGKYYIVLEDVNGIMWLVNADFPSLVTYTYTLQDGTDETVFTFSALSNFPTLKLNASINNAYACQNYSLVRVDEIKMLEKRYANINASTGIVYGYSNQVYKTVRPYRNSIKVEETFDGTDANTTIQFSIGLDDYQSSWHYNMLEYPYNKYVAVIGHLACGFEMGLVPSYNVQGSHQIGGGDTVTVTLVGGSQRGSEWAESWMEVTVAPVYKWELTEEWVCQPVEYRWVTVPDAYECSGTTKMTQEKKQLSTDGENWTDVEPLETRTGDTVIEYNSIDCGYIPPFNGKYRLTLSDSSVVDGECDSTSATNRSETSAYTTNCISVEIGDCVTNIGYQTFEGYISLSSVTIPNNVTILGYESFYYCYNLKRLNSDVDGVFNIPDRVTSIGIFAFTGCRGLISLNIPNSVTKINQHAFSSCSSLTSLTIPDSVTTIGNYAFWGCGSLTSITCLAVTPPTLENYSSQYSNFDNTNDCPIYVPCASVDTYKAASGWSNYASRIQCISLKYAITLNDSSVVSAECDSTSAITRGEISTYKSSTISVNIGDCVTNIEAYAFKNFDSLTSITIPNNVASLGTEAFAGCDSLSSANIGSGITYITGGLFNGCTNLTSVTLSDSVTSFNNYAFAGCYSLKSIIMPSGTTSITNAAFYKCTGLTSITCLAILPPTLQRGSFDTTNECPIYVPSESIVNYRAWPGWSDYDYRIQAIPDS